MGLTSNILLGELESAMYLDIYKELRTEGQFKHKLHQLSKEIASLEQNMSKDPGAEDKIQDLTIQIFKHCQYNAGFLVPYLFPQYPFTEPLSLNNRPYSYCMLHLQIGGYLCVRASRQIGKELRNDQRVATPTGWTPIGKLVEGDIVIDGLGNHTRVTGVYPQGKKEVFEIQFTDGSRVVSGREHLWVCRSSTSKTWTVRSLNEIMSMAGGMEPKHSQGLHIPLTAPVSYTAREHYISPYVLGVLIGDGCFRGDSCGLATSDSDILKRLMELMPDTIIRHTSAYNYLLSDKPKQSHTTPLLQELKRLKLWGRYSHEKFIPEEYQYDSIENRIELLRGLMDADGYIGKGANACFYTTSPKLATDVRNLVMSLGGKSTVSKKQTKYKNSKGEKVAGKPSYRVSVRLIDINPFNLERKANRFFTVKTKPTRIIKKITRLPQDDYCTCITVDSPEETFLTEDYIVTHNSTTFGARQLTYSHILPKFRSMYIVPHQSFLDTYANRVREMERAFRFYQMHPDYRQNLKYKEYPNGSIIYMVKCLSDSQEARSKTTDELLFDECQLLDPELIPDIEQTQKASRMPMNIYAGTSTTIESLLETKYQSSSQGVWLIKAPGFHSKTAGKGWLNCGDEKDIMRCIHTDGFINADTGAVIDVTDGQWVHQYERSLNAGYLGFHIPQVIIPDFVYNKRKWKDLVEDYQDYSPKKFMQEVLGIPTEEGQREISITDLKRMCDESETKASMWQRVKDRKYRYIVSGCDWGGSDYNPTMNTKVSFTVHVMLGVRHDGKIDIVHIRQYSGMDYRDIIEHICKDHKEAGATAIATDFGAGGAYNLLLREHPAITAERHMIFAYAGPNTKPIAMPPKGWYNQYTINRTDSITALYTAIKMNKLRCYNWSEAEDRLQDCLNLYRIPAETSGGTQAFKYHRHGAKPDDTLHAMNFAHILTELLQNKQFVEDVALRQRFDDIFAGRAQGAPLSPFEMGGMGIVSG